MNHIRTLQALAAATLVFTLAACGGSSSSSDDKGGNGSENGTGTGNGAGSDSGSGTDSLATAALQGIWQSPAGAASTLSTIALPDGKLWTIISNAGVTRLAKVSLSPQAAGFGGSGKSYTLGSSAASSSVNATAMVSVVAKTSLTGTLTASGAQPEAFAMAYQTRYDTPAVLSEFAGTWQATLGPGIVNWTIGSTGVLSGTRTTGCTYSGQLSLRAEQKAVVDASVAENCAGAVQQFSGVAVKSADSKGITLLMTSAADTEAVLLALR